MVKLTMIARVTDGLPLAEGLDDGREQRDLEFYKQQAKSLFKKLSQGQHEASRMSIESGPYVFHYIIEARVCYLTMCDRSYPKKLAFQYLEDLKNEFEKVNHSQIETVARPYAFIKFDTFIQKTRKLYLDTQTQRNLAKLNDDLYEVQQIMTRNVQEVLGVGEKLDRYPAIARHLNNSNRSNSGRGRWQSGNSNDRGPPLLPLPGTYQQRKFHGSSSGNSKFQQGARRPEGLVADLKLFKNEETLSMKCPQFQQPSEIARYSRAMDGIVYFDDRCLRRFRRHLLEELGADLNEGFETFVEKREDLECHGFGDLLACIRNAKIQLTNIHFVTFRNNLNKILETAYNRFDPWEMGVHRRNGTVYLDVHKLPERPQTEIDRRRTYWGYSFEHLATEDPNEGESEDSHIVDANVEYCAVIRTKLGAHCIIMGAEMDCYDRSSRDDRKYYVELKTSRELDNRTVERFEKQKLLKYWIQSFLAGVPRIIIGFRNDEGRLLRTQALGTEDIRQSVKGKNYWQGGVCLAFADEVLCWLYGSVKENQDYVLQFVPSANRIELLQSNSCPTLITSHVDTL